MPSRKRNKGKERKAKKAEQKVERIENEKMVVHKRWQGWARGENMLDNGSIITQCNHGCALMIPHDNNHPVSSFIDAFSMNRFLEPVKHISDNLRDTFNTYPEVWNDDCHRKMARDLLLRIGTNMILGKVTLSGMPKDIAYAVVVLENYDGSGVIDSTFNSFAVASKYRDLCCGESGAVRDELKIYRKRITCSCLKKMHLEVRKTFPKLGICYNCGEKKERSSLMVCSKCRVCHYCSRECQIEDWPSHKCTCDVLCEVHQRRRQID